MGKKPLPTYIPYVPGKPSEIPYVPSPANTQDDDEDVIVIPPLPDPIVKKKKVKCGECGMVFDGEPILYSCSKPRCPIFQNAVW